MTAKKAAEAARPCGAPASSCRVESVLSVDERGQMVLPKDLRRRMGVEAGDKLAVVSYENKGEICCIALIKADALSEMVKGLLGPVMKEIL